MSIFILQNVFSFLVRSLFGVLAADQLSTAFYKQVLVTIYSILSSTLGKKDYKTDS